MSTNPLNDISRVYLEQVASQEVEIEEGMTMKDFKQQRSRQKQKEKRAADKIAPGRRAGIHADKASPERAARHRANVDPDFEGNDERNYPGGKLRPNKVRKAKALGELGEASHLETDMKKRREANEKAVEDMKKTAAYKSMAATAAKKFDEALDPVGKEDADVDNDGKKGTNADKYLMKRRKAIGKAISTQEAKEVKRWWDDDGDGKGYEEGEVSGKFRRKKKSVKEGFSNWRQDLVEVMDDVEANKKIKEKKVENKIKINPNISEAVEEIGGTLLEMVEIDEMDYILESVYDELLEEGYIEDDIEDAIEYSLTEAKVTFGHDTSVEKKRSGLLDAARKKLTSAKKVAKQAVATGARKLAKGALGVARKMEGGDKTPSAAHTGTRKASTYRGAGVGQKERVSSGSYKAPEKKKTEPISDPWEGSATTPSKPKPKAKTKKAAAPKAAAPKAKAPAKKKKESKLDDLLASVRNEEVQINEKTLTAAETKEKERIVKSMKSKASDFEKRYPGRGKEVMYATATKMAKKIAEQAMELQPKVEPKPAKEKPLDTNIERQKYANLKLMQQKQQQMQRQKLNLQKQGKLPLETD